MEKAWSRLDDATSWHFFIDCSSDKGGCSPREMEDSKDRKQLNQKTYGE